MALISKQTVWSMPHGTCKLHCNQNLWHAICEGSHLSCGIHSVAAQTAPSHARVQVMVRVDVRSYKPPPTRRCKLHCNACAHWHTSSCRPTTCPRMPQHSTQQSNPTQASPAQVIFNIIRYLEVDRNAGQSQACPSVNAAACPISEVLRPQRRRRSTARWRLQRCAARGLGTRPCLRRGRRAGSGVQGPMLRSGRRRGGGAGGREGGRGGGRRCEGGRRVGGTGAGAAGARGVLASQDALRGAGGCVVEGAAGAGRGVIGSGKGGRVLQRGGGGGTRGGTAGRCGVCSMGEGVAGGGGARGEGGRGTGCGRRGTGRSVAGPASTAEREQRRRRR